MINYVNNLKSDTPELKNINSFLQLPKFSLLISEDRLCGLVARVTGYRPWGPGIDSRPYRYSE
jgi:hypothetical protein